MSQSLAETITKSSLFERLRATQFPQLGLQDVYADWTGAALAPSSLIESHRDFLLSTPLGNPHSHHAPSMAAMESIMETRREVLEYFNADNKEYEVIFTSGATGAIRLLEHFKFQGGELLLTADNHNSVNGLRETAKYGGAVTRYAPINKDLSLDEETLLRMLSYPRSTGQKLFAYPAKSNYAGTLHSLDWVRIAREKGWYVLLDAAAYSANHRLDLQQVKPDFVPVSFYKLFGFPTGVGCLLVRKGAYPALHKKWFAGGSILLVSVMKDFHAPEALGYARFEDGTVNFGMIPSVRAGLQFMKSLNGIDTHAAAVATSLYDQLNAISDGPDAAVLQSARGNDAVTFSVKRGDKIIDAWEFEQFANARGIYVRTGCFCNPGVNEKVFEYRIDSYEKLYNDEILPDAITIDQLRQYSGDIPIGAIRASFGYANIESDAHRIAEVVREFIGR